MLKFENIAIGTKIKAFDFEPIPDRPDRYLIGTIEAVEEKQGAKMYAVRVSDGDEYLSQCAGEIVHVPMEIAPRDYDNRITVIA